MNALDWFPARYEAHGSTSGEGATKLLGRPKLDPLTVLMRETVQNAWDARTGETLDFRVELRRFTPAELGLLRTTIFAEGSAHVLCETTDASQADTGHPGLAEALGRGEVWALEIGDRGTAGLGGPLRADLDPDEHQATDFIDFIFNLGAPRDTPLGGGTYGFGKTISYVTSRAQTILVGTRTRVSDGSSQHRFIASAIGRHWATEGRRYTGRHWWGRVRENRVEPITDTAAADLMAGLGMHEFPTDGTSIVIVDPGLQGRTPQQALEFLMESFVWHLWPKLVPQPDSAHPPVATAFLLEGREIPLPDPRGIPSLRPFIEALDALRRHDIGKAPTGDLFPPPVVKTIDYGAQREPIGTLALIQQPAIASTSEHDADEDSARPFTGACRHTVLMRQAELVVDYLEGPASVVPGYQWAGAFRVLPEKDEAFSAAEPPAHDSWEWQSVADRRNKSHVRVALRKLAQEMRIFTTPQLPAGQAEAEVSVAGLGDRLRSLMPGLAGTAPARQPSGGGGGSGRPRKARVALSQPRPVFDGEHTSVVDATITAEADDRVILSVSVGVLTDTGAESSPPVGASIPWVRAVSIGGRRLEPFEPGKWLIDVVDKNCLTTIEVASRDPIAARISATVEPVSESSGTR